MTTKKKEKRTPWWTSPDGTPYDPHWKYFMVDPMANSAGLGWMPVFLPFAQRYTCLYAYSIYIYLHACVMPQKFHVSEKRRWPIDVEPNSPTYSHLNNDDNDYYYCYCISYQHTSPDEYLSPKFSMPLFVYRLNLPKWRNNPDFFLYLLRTSNRGWNSSCCWKPVATTWWNVYKHTHTHTHVSKYI